MDRKELIEKYVKFFESKGHVRISNFSLIPENDPTVLFTTAGMHPLVPYLLGQKHPSGKRLVNVQACIRTGDIDEVGDTYHHTFFEMLGNWSLGDYWKKEAIKMTFEFHNKILKIPLERYAVSVFSGDGNLEGDSESIEIWKSLSIKPKRVAIIKKDNWWGPAGKIGPCGPSTEQFYWKPKDIVAPEKFDPKDERWVEIGNDVFMEFVKDKRLILVDGMYCLYDDDFNLSKELLDLVNSFNSHNLLVVNKFRERGYNLVKNYDKTKDTNWRAFSMEEDGIKKEDPKYFEILLKKFNLAPEEVLYFDHDEKSVKTAESLGILSRCYKDNSQIKSFIEENLYVYLPAKQKNIDFGGGVERTIAALNGLEDNYLADMWKPIIEAVENLSGRKYGKDEKVTRAMRIIADHVKAAVFVISDGVVPGNSERGYVLRRLIRRAVRYARMLSVEQGISRIAEPVYEIYDDYKLDKEKISRELDLEEERFLSRLEKGLSVFEKVSKGCEEIKGKDAFLLYQSYGFPIEMTVELAKEKGIDVDKRGFEAELEKHQKLSKTASAGRFKSGLADNSKATTKLHTATHLLNEALNRVLGRNIEQKGSNITSERLRFDFSFDRKLTEEEKKKMEDMINGVIRKAVPVTMKEMSLEEAKRIGARGVFEDKYGEKVRVYSVGDFSKEICGGPHVKNTSELGTFRIQKETSSSSGVRRIKAVLE